MFECLATFSGTSYVLMLRVLYALRNREVLPPSHPSGHGL